MIRPILALGLAALAVMHVACRPSPRPADAQRPTAKEAASARPQPAAPPLVVDDMALSRKLEATAEKMMAAGQTTPIAELRKQLKRAECELSLPQPRTAPLPWGEVYRRGLRGVAVVAGMYKCNKCPRWHASLASGFFLTASGALVTNYHVVNDTKKHSLVAMTHDGGVLAVREVLAASAVDDAAIVQVDVAGQEVEPLPLAPDPPVGAPVGVLSHPSRHFSVFTRGVVSRYFLMSRAGGKSTMVAVTADFARGSSGGPVLDEAGCAVGFVASTSSVYYKTSGGKQQNLQMVFKQCVPASAVRKLIKKAEEKALPQAARQ